MKKIFALFAIVGLLAFTGCEGPEGPPGQDGYNAQDSEVFEVGPDFTAANGYSMTYPLNPVMLSGDNILVYELVSTGGVDTWALLPQVYYFNNGLETAQYNYTFSYNQFRIFIKGSLADYSQLPSSFRLGKTFRVVIILGDDGVNAKKAKPDYSDYNAVIERYNIDDSNVKKID
ncbi:hypothetical protein EV143_107263 [Flavobacterium chryseum]|uniref:hypothetical protein n=1 Tax=Flavobacterium sp. P3160 TaxID=2512113 RepID=UPI0010622867|nr:hypothetical protein [Flavobacterium sp. P3160]TDO72957.1 hypothetical protein EV143_107263 [Flavobacterium sp. P3160]